MQCTVDIRNNALDGMETFLGVSPTLVIRSGLMPADAATAAVGTVLATIILPSDWLANASGGVKQLSGTWQDLAADATGRASYYRLFPSGGGKTFQGYVSEPYQGSKLFAAGDQIHTGGNIYRATVGGTSGAASPPTGVGASITDGTVTWSFVQSFTEMTIDNANFNVNQQVNVISYQWTLGGA